MHHSIYETYYTGIQLNSSTDSLQHTVMLLDIDVLGFLCLAFKLPRITAATVKNRQSCQMPLLLYCNFGRAISTLQHPQAPENNDLGNLVTVA